MFETINEGFGEKWKLNPGAICEKLAKLTEKGYIEKGKIEDGETVYEPTKSNNFLGCRSRPQREESADAHGPATPPN